MTASAHGASAEPLFERASRDVLAYLHEHVPLAMWAVTRVENDRQTYLTVEDTAYGLEPAGSHPWLASFCIHMAAGQAPRVAPEAKAVPLYAAAGVNDLIPIGAYAGAAIEDADGSLFGAICGLDPEVKGADLPRVEPLLVLLSRLLTVALTADRQAQRLARTALEERLRAYVDALTDVYSRGAWDRLLAEEATLFQVTADPTAIVVVDLDGLKRTNTTRGTARATRCSSEPHAPSRRWSAVMTRSPGWGVTSSPCCCASARRTRRASARPTSVRRCSRPAWPPRSASPCARPGQSLRDTQHAADTAMYQDKRAHRRARGDDTG